TGRMSLFGDEIETITEFDPLTGRKTADLKGVKIYANSHYVTPRPTLNQAISQIKDELKERVDWLVANGKLLEAQRLEQRTTFDLEMMDATGSCAGIENYSRYLTGRRPGEPPPESVPTPATWPAPARPSRRRPSSSTSRRTRCCSSTRATRRCRRSA